jgi:hypothetical protein
MMMSNINVSPTPSTPQVRARGRRPLQEQRSGHPALRPGLCVQCYGKAAGILCPRCTRETAAEHHGLAGAISRLSSTSCQHCSSESIGVVVFAGNKILPFCEPHVREWRGLDFIPALGFVKYVSIPALVVGH